MHSDFAFDLRDSFAEVRGPTSPIDAATVTSGKVMIALGCRYSLLGGKRDEMALAD
jgi:hypothetical protein